ncbi:hypothetical protein ADUPG1_013623 [Aduncisulcus paluster]|uniref:Uncharacterized protein n=1 Tax=Aduncisulcus paluster TaxID=2918883 RepID=A0ABQ5K764_9EUKA|nr:hypothetical protein ADUPG1_013623 [Aduncisulcus paluster]
MPSDTKKRTGLWITLGALVAAGVGAGAYYVHEYGVPEPIAKLFSKEKVEDASEPVAEDESKPAVVEDKEEPSEKQEDETPKTEE